MERRAKLLAPALYCPLPRDIEFCEAVVLTCMPATREVNDFFPLSFALVLTYFPPQFVYERDSSALNFQRPVFELLGGKLWPVVCIELVRAGRGQSVKHLKG